MAGTVDKSQTYFIRAAGDQWELWSFPDTKRAQFVRRLEKPGEVPGATIVSLPAERTISYPAWLATEDRAVIREMLQLQLEQRGLVGRNNSTANMDFRVIESRENQTLAVATVLQSEFPEELTFERALRFEPSALTLPLPQDRLVIWREKERLVVSATRGRDPVIYQVLSDREITEAVALELKCVTIQLEAERLCERLLGVTLWGDFTSEEIDRVKRVLGLTVSRDSMPPPILPSGPSKLLPASVAALHSKKRRRARIRTIILGVAALYILLIAALGAWVGWQTVAIRNLQEELKGQTPTVTAIQGTADRWRRVEWAVNPKLFPVELLYQFSGLLPPDGLRLTGMDLEKGKVIVKGEASTAPGAFKFAEDIKANPELQMFTWRMPSPTLRPDGRAEFTIEGEPKVAKIE
jgi:hypothetical protein